MKAVYRRRAENSVAQQFIIDIEIGEKNLRGSVTFDLGSDGNWHRGDMTWRRGQEELSKADLPYARAARSKVADLFEADPGTEDGSFDLTEGELIAARLLLERESVL